jgi:hypothetical protein
MELSDDDVLIEYKNRKDIKGVKHRYIDIFNYEKTIQTPEFKNYYKYRTKFKSLPIQKLEKVFGKDEVRHFEIAYQIWILEEL